MKVFLSLLAAPMASAALASPNPSSQSEAAEPPGIPASFLQPMTLNQGMTIDQDTAPASLAQAPPQIEEPAPP